MLELYGHPFSSYTWKALIALYANETPFTFRMLDGQNPEFYTRVQAAGPMGKFPLLVDGETQVFEASAIIEYLALHYPGPAPLLPADPDAAIRTRMIDRVFDNYVMNAMQESVDEAIRHGAVSDEVQKRVDERLLRTYRWIEKWLEDYQAGDAITLIECAAAPSLFYADWVTRIPEDCPNLRDWRAHLLALPPISRCVENARPFRAYFPLGAPDRD
ncbi:glutathione S-transferase family protein [Novosphingobium sp. SG707]|uniref:glutathione S-transferase family protein n=1 Tax=Novosphingobium sp. SG707 TaxID=2586996 RepID=UPI0017D45DC9|nr:glutathione S-transferase family protein [Novosphingobium sp. SG707]NKJ02083.1 glutathione S-transferase [Novosphingobium sp. SG707]